MVGGAAVCVYPECVINQDCPRDKACFSQRCRDPCVDACGLNALCTVVNHQAVCSCPPGFFGEPRVQCKRPVLESPPPPRPECVDNSECPGDRACINQQCRNPCAESHVCGANAECRVQQHRPLCTCRHGFTGNAQLQCFDSE